MGKDHTNYYRVKYTAYAELDGEKVDIVGFQAKYELDRIPTIKVWPTIGRDPSNDKEAEAVSKFLDADQYTPLKVYANFETEMDNPEEDEPGFPYGEDVLIFDGYLMGSDYTTSRSPVSGTMRLEVSGANWLTGLAGTDSHTEGTTVKGPAGWDELANPSSPDGTKGVGVLDIQALITVNPERAAIDFWLQYVKLVFRSITRNRSVWGATENESAFKALTNMDNTKAFTGDATNVLRLNFGGGDVDLEFLGQFLTQFVSKKIFSMWRHGEGGSLWGALDVIRQLFLFHVVPLIETAGCCAVYGALGGEPHRTITTNDYTAINMYSVAQKMTTKYVVVGGQDTFTVPRSTTPRKSGTQGLIGFYDINKEIRKAGDVVVGQSIIARAPMWLAAETEIGVITRESLGVGGEKFGIPDAMNPDAYTGAPEKDYQLLYNNVRTSELGDNYAKAKLQEANLVTRGGGLSGRFRLDISPGSLVKVEVIDDKFADADAEPKYVFGMVNTVLLELDSGRSSPIGTAATTFALKYVRTEEEHDKDYLTSKGHPLWGVAGSERFVGTKLWIDKE